MCNALDFILLMHISQEQREPYEGTLNNHQWQHQGEKTKGGGDKQSNEGVRNIYEGAGACPGDILRSRIPEMPFTAFWGLILQNSEDYKTS